jgi:predicted metal-binding protein
MDTVVKVAIVICDRYKSCAGGKCFRALQNREGAFERYLGKDVEIVGFTSCGGCPGGNIEYAPEEMKKNDAQVIHLATGLVVGYPPCPHIGYFREFIGRKYGLEVVVGTHPIPQKYFKVHEALGTWDTPEWQDFIAPTLADEKTRLAYD